MSQTIREAKHRRPLNKNERALLTLPLIAILLTFLALTNNLHEIYRPPYGHWIDNWAYEEWLNRVIPLEAIARWEGAALAVLLIAWSALLIKTLRR